MGFEGEGDALAGEVDVEDGDGDALLELDDGGGVFDEGVGELGDVDEAILVDADVDEGAEGGDVGDDAGEFHAGLEVFEGVDVVGEGEGFELLAGVFGRPLAFLSMQEEYWSKSLTWPWVGAADAWGSVWWRKASDAVMVGWQEFLFLGLGLACAVWAWLRLRPSYAVWVTLNWLLWASTKFVLSVPRYTLVLFPLYILVARAGLKRPTWGAAYVVWSLLFMALFASRFVRGAWAF